MILEILERSDKRIIDQIKIQIVLYASTKCSTNNQIAKYLGLNRRTLSYWLYKYSELEHLRKKITSNNPYWDDNPSWKRSNEKN